MPDGMKKILTKDRDNSAEVVRNERERKGSKGREREKEAEGKKSARVKDGKGKILVSQYTENEKIDRREK